MAELALDAKQKLTNRNKMLFLLFRVTAIVFTGFVMFAGVASWLIVKDTHGISIVVYDFCEKFFLGLCHLLFSLQFLKIRNGERSIVFCVANTVVAGLWMIIWLNSILNDSILNKYHYIFRDTVFWVALFAAIFIAGPIAGYKTYFRPKWLTLSLFGCQLVFGIWNFRISKDYYWFLHGWISDTADSICALWNIVIVLCIVYVAIGIVTYLLATKWYCDNCGCVCSYDMKFCKKCGTKNPTVK